MGRYTISERLARSLPLSFRSFVASHAGSHRRFVGPGDVYDVSGANQFNLLTMLGLRGTHRVLDIGCGSLRAGRLFIAYLEPGHYFGVEPERWLVESAIRAELGRGVVALKRPTFQYRDDFRLSAFGETFDFLLAASVFTHTAPRQIQTCLLEAAAVMPPDGVFVATFALGAHDYDGDEWAYPGLVTYTLDRVKGFARAAGLSCECVDFPWMNPRRVQSWFAFTPIS